jgi:hypothetical protein
MQIPYIADATQLEAGSIIGIERPLSSAGKPTYPHLFVVLTIPDPLIIGVGIPLVGISSRINPKSADPARHVAMKWLARKGGDPETGLDRPCYACVDFMHGLHVYSGTTFDLEVAAAHAGKFVRQDKLQTIVAAANAWARRKTP